ncbi:hypothetical protein [Pseudomonas sp. EL_65y_Pfl2_R95]|uniref:hypothetical protein n=1 Tax=Pseudomonas sp. EL_65y_Pfl2_R95 TaxID=3088698 RepID=UPI0030DCF78C
MDFQTLVAAARHAGFDVTYSYGRYQVSRDGGPVMHSADDLEDVAKFIKAMTYGACA